MFLLLAKKGQVMDFFISRLGSVKHKEKSICGDVRGHNTSQFINYLNHCISKVTQGGETPPDMQPHSSHLATMPASVWY